MCFHESNTKTRAEMEQRYDAKFEYYEYQPVFHDNAFNYAQSPVISMGDKKHFTPMYWGLIPFWSRDLKNAMDIRSKTFNAKSETITELPSFRNPIKTKRCLIPADGFFEWMDFNKKKYPFYISLKDNALFSFGGIYDEWQDKNTGRRITSFSIVTTEANALMAKIHNSKKRMPLMLQGDQEKIWLDKDTNVEELKSVMKPFPEVLMKAHTISKLITDRNSYSNVPEVLSEFEYPELL